MINNNTHIVLLPSHITYLSHQDDINSLVQDCNNSSTLAMELLQPCAKPSIYDAKFKYQMIIDNKYMNIGRLAN